MVNGKKSWVLWLVLGYVVAAFAGPGLSPVAAQNSSCPYDTTLALISEIRTFTDSAGNTTNYQLALPFEYDATIPGPVAIYFHGNDHDNGGSFEPSVGNLQFGADINDMPVVAIESIHSRTNSDGTVVKAWQADDPLLLRELLASDFDGCIAIDPQQLYLVSGSEGTCYLAVVLTQWLGYEYGGGFAGLCGCWQFGDRDWEVDLQPLRDNWKIFIQNTTEDPLYEYGLIGLDDFGYNMGLNVRTDLMRSGGHCEDLFLNVPRAIAWMRGQGDYPLEFVDVPHWQQVDFRVNSAQAIAYDAMRERFLIAVNRPDLTDAQRQMIHDRRIVTGLSEPDDYQMWLSDNFPQVASPALFVMATDDYGESFTQLTQRSEVVKALLVREGGEVLMATGSGILSSSDGGVTFTMRAFDGMNVRALVEGTDGRLFAAVEGLLPLQRSSDGGQTWQSLDVDTGSFYENSRNDLQVHGVRLMVYSGEGVLHFSDDGGESFVQATIPGTLPVDAVHQGDRVFAVTDNGGRLVGSSDLGQSWGDLPGYDTHSNTVGITPDGVLWVNQIRRMQYRSSDDGATFDREPGLHNAANMDIAYGPGEQRMVAAHRGILRHSAAVVSTPPAADPDAGATPAIDAGMPDAPGMAGGNPVMISAHNKDSDRRPNPIQSKRERKRIPLSIRLLPFFRLK